MIQEERADWYNRSGESVHEIREASFAYFFKNARFYARAARTTRASLGGVPFAFGRRGSGDVFSRLRCHPPPMIPRL